MAKAQSWPLLKDGGKRYPKYYRLYVASLIDFHTEAGQRTDAHLTDPSTDRPTDQRNPTEKYHSISSNNCATGRFGSLPRYKVFNDAIGPKRKFGPMTQFKQIFSLFYLEFVSAWPPSLPSHSARPPLCRPNLTQRMNTMILILILSDATYNFEIRFVAMIRN